MSGCSARLISSRRAPSCAPPSQPRPRSGPRSKACSGLEGSADVAAPCILQRRIVQVDPIHGREQADRDRLVLLQGHQVGVPIVGALAAREADALDLVSLPDQALERLLLLRAA